MPVFLSSATLGNAQTLLTLGGAGELMAWFYPHKDHAQHIHQCLPCVYLGHGGQGSLHWSFGPEFSTHQAYLPGSNALQTTLEGLGLRITFTDVVPDELPVLVRRIEVENISDEWKNGGFYLYGDWNMDGIRAGNGVVFSRGSGILLQNHRETALAIGGDALQGWQCGKAGENWGHNAKKALQSGVLQCQDLEIGDVDWAVGFYAELAPGEKTSKTLMLALGRGQDEALSHFHSAAAIPFEQHLQNRMESDQNHLAPGLETLAKTGTTLPEDLQIGYERSLLCLPLLCGEEGVAVAAPEFDPEFEACGGYGYLWPRDGGEYISGLLDAGYPQFSERFFDWCAQHQAVDGLWHQRYFLNGQPAPNWCLPPETLQIDQVGAVGWAYGKWLSLNPGFKTPQNHREMLVKAADYLISRQDEATGVHRNAFDTWETFVGSFTYSNAAITAAFLTTFQVTGEAKYQEAATKMKTGVLTHFVRESPAGYRYLTRGFKADGSPDEVVDSASLGAIEPFGLLDLEVPAELDLAVGTLRAVTEKLEVDWMGSRAIRRFEGDAYVGGVPACVNTLWMARCCLHVAQKTGDSDLIERAQGYLQVVLRRATPTGLLPELMQGPTGQPYWAAPHGWAMASFVSGVLKLSSLRSQTLNQKK
ncbi:MAG TPA: hypothetical protein VF627_04965 [Abditibacterium sp.]|jgi:oligosaccharide amylase